MNCEQARDSLLDALAGAVDEPTEQGLERHLESCRRCGDEAAALRRTWEELSAVGGEDVPSDRMRIRFRAALGAYEAAVERSWSRRLGRWVRRLGEGPAERRPLARAALAALLLATGIGLGWGSSRWLGPGAELARLRAEVAAMDRAATLALLEHPSASERLRGVSWGAAAAAAAAAATTADAADDRVIDALVEAARRDESVNVRLAAIEALAAHVERPAVRSGLLASLEERPQPHLQLAVSRLFAAEERRRDDLDRLLASDLLDPEVRRILLEESGEI